MGSETALWSGSSPSRGKSNKDDAPAIERWLERFDECWENDRDLREKLPDRAVRKAIVRSHLADIAAWEKETGRPLLFSDDVTGSELTLKAPFGGGRYQLQGRIDRLFMLRYKQLRMRRMK